MYKRQRLNRERARNAIDGATTRALGATFDELTEDPEVWVVVLTGTGDRAFCAGMDLKAFAAGEMGDILSAKGGFAGIAARRFPKPVSYTHLDVYKRQPHERRH